MKFYNYINEKELDVKEIIDKIDKDCKLFINDWKKLNIQTFLYSGRKGGIEFDKRKVRKNRNPMNTPEQIHKFLDKLFKKRFGVKARSNSIFCTWDLTEARSYGHPYMIFPIRDYTAISSEQVEDLFYKLSEIIRMNSDRFNFMFSSVTALKQKGTEKDFKTLMNILEKEFDSLNYKKGLLKHNNEIMITCNEYYVVNHKYEREFLNYFKG